MSTAQELLEVLYAAAVQHASYGGAIGAVSRADASLVIDGRQPDVFRRYMQQPTVMQLLPSDTEVSVIVLGGRPGIPQNQVIATIPIAGRPLPEVAEQALTVTSDYIATTTA